jgi:hypothetical protein
MLSYRALRSKGIMVAFVNDSWKYLHLFRWEKMQ